MKTLRVIALVFLLGSIGASALNGQALVLNDFSWKLRTHDGIYPAVDMMAVFTPSGNILHKQTFLIDLEDSIIPEKGVNKISFTTKVRYQGEIYEMLSVNGKVYPDGKVYIIFHTNGSGSVTPSKKDK